MKRLAWSIAGGASLWLACGCSAPYSSAVAAGTRASALPSSSATADASEDSAKPTPTLANQGLEVAIEQVATADTKEARQQFYRELLASRLILPAPGPADGSLPPGRTIAEYPRQSLRFIVMQSPEGERAAVAFTSAAAYQAWQPGSSVPVVAPAQEVLSATVAGQCQALLINPAGPVRTVLSRPIVAALADGLVPEGWEGNELKLTAASSASRFISAPRDLDAAFVDALRARSASVREIQATYLVETSTEGGTPSLVVVLELQQDTDPQPVVQSIGEAIRPTLPRGKYVDILPLTAGTPSTEPIRRKGELVFVR